MLAKLRDQSVYRIDINSKAVNLHYLLYGRNNFSLCCNVNSIINSSKKNKKERKKGMLTNL
jgi:hypothetical protein